MKNIITVILGLLLFVPAGLKAEFWNLPSEVNLQNSSVSFEVDSTWHLVEGKVGDLSGKVWLNENSDYRSVRAEIKLVVKSFDTDGESRDQRMLEILRAEQYPEVVFKINEDLSGNCNPAQLENGSLCEEKITGDLVINGVSKKVLLSGLITKQEAEYQIKAVTTIKWQDFNIEDPSILIAKLDQLVKIKVLITLRAKEV